MQPRETGSVLGGEGEGMEETAQQRVTCQTCNATFEKKRSPRKGYKVTVLGVLCDKCYGDLIRTTTYEYGCGKEFYGGYEEKEFAVEQMYQLNKLWNGLVEIDRWERIEYRKLTSDPILEAELAVKKESLDALKASIQQQKATERKRKIKIGPEIIAAKKQIGQECKVLYGKLKEERARMKTVNQQAIEELKVNTENKIKAATSPGAHPLPWTMIAPLKARFTTASNQAKKHSTMLRFQRFDGSGIITVPFTSGLALAAAYRNDEVGRFQIASELMSTHPREKRTLCRIVVASDPKTWLTVPVIFHRPLPPESNIRGITVVREMLAGTPRWKLVVTVRTVIENKPSTTFSCGIDIGWRKLPDGSIRVAYLVDELGHTEELILSAGDMEEFRKLDRLKSIMENNFNRIRDKLIVDLKQQAAMVPQTLQPLVQHIAKWKSPVRLVKAMSVWANNRFPGDEEMWDAVRYWYDGAKVKPDPI